MGTVAWTRRGKPQLWWPTFPGLPPWGGRTGGPATQSVTTQRGGPLPGRLIVKMEMPPPRSSQGFVWGHERVSGLQRPETQMAAEKPSEGTDFCCPQSATLTSAPPGAPLGGPAAGLPHLPSDQSVRTAVAVTSSHPLGGFKQWECILSELWG